MVVRDEPSFGQLLRRYRKAAGLTQEALAERALLSAYTISALERGTNVPAPGYPRPSRRGPGAGAARARRVGGGQERHPRAGDSAARGWAPGQPARRPGA